MATGVVRQSDSFSVTCNMNKGGGTEKSERIETWQVPGVDGYGAQRMGLGDTDFAFRAIQFDTTANLVTWYANLRACKSSLVTITDDRNIVWVNLILEEVSGFDPQVAYNPAAPTNFRGEVLLRGKIS